MCNLLTAGICYKDKNDNKDAEFKNDYGDNKDYFGLGSLFVISELQVTRKA